MKRFMIGLLFSVVLVVMVAGCTSSDDDNPSLPVNQAQNQTPGSPENEQTDNQDEVVPEEITIVHPLGETTLPTNPQRLVVTDYGIIDALTNAGVDVENTILGLPKSGHVPPHLSEFENDKYVDLGNLVEVNFETINELKPDLIIITNRLTDSYEELSRIAPTLFLTMPAATYMESLERNLQVLAQVFTDQADEFNAKLDEIRTRTANIVQAAEGKTALLIQTNDDALSVFGVGSRYSSIYTDFGFSVTDETISASTHGQSSSFEYIAEQKPDYLFVIDRSAAISLEGATGAERLLDNELINGMDAAVNNRIFYLDATNWYTVAGGITATLSMIEEIEHALGL